MSPFLFWIFALLTLVFGAAVVINRNPVASALSLVVSFLGLAALFVSLDAFFVGIIQVLVYAGAVMVLFLFIIMLLNLQAEERRRINWLAGAGGIGVALVLLVQICSVIGHFQAARTDVSAVVAIDNRRCAEHRGTAFPQLQSAIPNHRCSRAGCDHRRRAFKQTRTKELMTNDQCRISKE